MRREYDPAALDRLAFVLQLRAAQADTDDDDDQAADANAGRRDERMIDQ